MSTALVTGATGLVGTAVCPALEARGWTVRRFDLSLGDDLRDEAAVAAAVAGCDLVVHAGAIPHDSRGTPAEIMDTNVLGTWHILLAAEANATSRVISFSSVQVFGCAEGEGEPDYVPMDDDHPRRATRPYGLSKRLAETMCEAWTARTGIPTIVLRPVLIVSEERARDAERSGAARGAFVHADDVADAVLAATTAPVSGHVRLTLSDPDGFDTSAARRVLGWQAARGWP